MSNISNLLVFFYVHFRKNVGQKQGGVWSNPKIAIIKCGSKTGWGLVKSENRDNKMWVKNRVGSGKIRKSR